MLSYIDLIKNIETNKNQKLVIVDFNGLMRNLCKFFNLLIISENKTNPIFKLKNKEPTIIYDLIKLSEIKIINEENILIYKISQKLLSDFSIFCPIKFNFDVVFHFPNLNIFLCNNKQSNDEFLFKQFSKYDKRNFLKLLFSKKIKFRNTDCPICYEKLNEKNLIKTNCSHYFCKNCISKLEKLSCPMCRQQIIKLYPNKIECNAINEINKKILEMNEKILLLVDDLRIKKFFHSDKIIFKKINNLNHFLLHLKIEMNKYINIFFYSYHNNFIFKDMISYPNITNKNLYFFY